MTETPTPQRVSAASPASRESTSQPPPGAVLPISLLVSSARLIIERHLGLVWVSGEISNFTRAASGHCYFNLKDAQAQARCVFFRQKAQHVAFALRDGLQVEVRATPSIYEARGEFQLNVENVRLAGIGALYEKFAQLKAKLDAAGWFAEARKRPLPAYPRAIGVVTSTRAAALRDILTTLHRRWPAAGVVIYPTAVQGEGRGRGNRAGDTHGQRTRRGGRADRRSRRRLDRGSVGVQRGGAGARRVRLRAARRVRRRARDRFHDLRFRRRPARADAHRGRGGRHAGPRRRRASRRTAGASPGKGRGARPGGARPAARRRGPPARASRRAHRAGNTAPQGIRAPDRARLARAFHAAPRVGVDAAGPPAA